jgi:hypothetical protein
MIRPWTPDDTQALLRHVSSKKNVGEIARLQRRTVASVESKLKSIAASLYFNEHLPYEEVEAKTGIKKESLIVKRVTNSSVSGSPKTEVPTITSNQIIAAIPSTIQVITTKSPFSLESLSTLLISSVSCLLTTTS